MRRDELNSAEDDAAGRAVDRDLVALVELVAREGRRPLRRVEREVVTARDAGDAFSAGDNGGVRGQTAVGREDPRRVPHAVVVVRRSLPANEDHALPG